jgi:hypothetical protein
VQRRKYVTDPFKARVNRAVLLYLRELKDGCVDCATAGTYCRLHDLVAKDVILHPARYLKVTSTDVTFLYPEHTSDGTRIPR